MLLLADGSESVKLSLSLGRRENGKNEALKDINVKSILQRTQTSGSEDIFIAADGM